MGKVREGIYTRLRKFNKSFRELIAEILKGETDMSFAIKTGVSPNMLYRLRKSADEKNLFRKAQWFQYV